VNDSDTVFFCGDRAEEKPPAKLWIYHKRVGEITTHKDPQKRTTVFEAVAARHGLHQVLSVGRLDINSEGLLLLTNHNSIAHEFETAHVERVYKVRVFGRIEMLLSSRYAHTLSGEGDNVTSIELRNVSINGTKYAPILIRFSMPIHTKNVQQNFWISVSLYEGKNREIRKILALLGLQVNRLIRTKFGTFELGDLPLGALQEVPTASLRIAASGTVNELATN
jgi:23S rRNA pseudouridine2605 synthase